MVAWVFGFWMWRQTLARGVLYLLFAEYSVIICGAWPGTLVTWPWCRLSMIYCCAPRFWSQICVTCWRCRFPVSVALSCVGARCLGPVGWLHTFEMVMEHFANPNLSVVVVKCWFLGFVVRDRTFYVYCLYCNLTYITWFLIVYLHQWLPCRLRMSVPLSYLWVIWMTIIRSGWVLRPRTVMELRPLTLQQSLVAISWLSAQPTHVVEHLTSWWLMSLT